MGIMNALREAEEKSRQAARRGRERVRATWDETERVLRRKMRIRPKKSAPENAGEAQRNTSVRSTTERKPIVSVHGRDLSEAELRQRNIA
ncbi:MAG TPA: hypothetical protein VFA60_08345 [Terriglobales bacterium]|nr:hypothetical protein [Terriglobales bacterium]